MQLRLILLLSYGLSIISTRQVDNFIIVFQGSQGSSYLIEMLSQLQKVCILGYEPLGDISMDASLVLHKLLYPGNSSLQNHIRNIGHLLDSREHTSKCTGPEAIYGLKARLNPSVLTKLVNMQSFQRTQFVLLRRNLMKQAVGTYRRKYCGLGQFELRVKIEQKKTQEEIKNFKNKKCNMQMLPLQKLCLLYWRYRQSLSDLARQHRDRMLEISYEDIMRNITHVIDNQIAPFLSIDTARKTRREASLQKASPDLLCRSIENFRTVCTMTRRDLPSEFTAWINADQCKKDSDTRVNCCPEC